VLEQEQENNKNQQEEDDIFRSFRLSRILIPIFFGLGLVFYMLWRKFNPADFARIEWSSHTFTWLGIALLLLVIRHLCYALRLYILADGSFSYRKCIELLFIWEFSTAVAPTSAGGAAIALFVLTLEKIPPARVAVIVIYKVLLDSIFQFTLFPIMFLLMGWQILSPNAHSLSSLDGTAWTFVTVYCLMIIQGTLLILGLFVYPSGVKWLLDKATNLPILRRFREKALKFGEDIVAASSVIKHKPFPFHLRAFGATAAAWCCRFLLINCLIIALTPNLPSGVWTQVHLFGRAAANYIVMLFAPTPGGSGFAEAGLVYSIKDYVPETIGYIVALIWRLMTYYPYLITGAIIIPNWIRKLLEERKIQRLAMEEGENTEPMA
jgi:glycosyltransferase 2 family protein